MLDVCFHVIVSAQELWLLCVISGFWYGVFERRRTFEHLQRIADMGFGIQHAILIVQRRRKKLRLVAHTLGWMGAGFGLVSTILN